MAARTNRPLHNPYEKARIRASNLLARLADFAEGKNNQGRGKDTPIKMSREQIRAAEVYIKRYLPELRAVELTGPEGGPVQASVKVEFVGKAP